jgi:CRP-like cAMP-binding protein
MSLADAWEPGVVNVGGQINEGEQVDVSLHSQNQLVASLPAPDLELLCSRMWIVRLRAGAVLHEPGSELKEAYFPHAGAVSLGVVLGNAQVLQTGVVGREGVVGGGAALDAGIGTSRAEVHIEGAASSIYLGHLRHVAEQSEALRSALLRYQEFVLCQAQWTAACNASHTLEQRFCRCLLRYHQVSDQQILPLTQEHLAELIGVMRTSVSLAAHRLRVNGAIAIRRGNTQLLKLDALQAAACECCGKIRAHYAALFGETRQRMPDRNAIA